MVDKLGPFLLGPNDTPENGIYTGDALECMRAIPPDSIDVVLIDPPYCAGGVAEASRMRAKGHGLRSETVGRFGWFIGDNMGTSGVSYLMRQIALESFRIGRETGSFLMFCDWRMLPVLEPVVESAGLRFQSLIVWDKGHMGLGHGFRHQHELILHFTLGTPRYYELGASDVILAKRVRRSDRMHQTQKPLVLVTQLLRVVCPPSGIVVDSFVGSGTTAVAAKALGLRYLAFEIDPAVAEMARERVRNTQMLLFVLEPEQMTLGGD